MEREKPFVNVLLEENKIPGFVDFLKRETSGIIDVYYALTGLKIFRVHLGEKLVKVMRGSRSLLTSGSKASLKRLEVEGSKILSEICKFMDHETISNELSKIENHLEKLSGIRIKPRIAIDTNITKSRYLEEIIRKILQSEGDWGNVRVIVPKIVIQELFHHFSTQEFKGNAELGVNGFPMLQSRLSRYALTNIIEGLDKGVCEIYGRLLIMETGRREFSYISDLFLLEQLEKYGIMRPLSPIIFITSDFALSAISHIRPTIYLKRPTLSDEKLEKQASRDLPTFLKYLVMLGGLILLIDEQGIAIALSYSWKGITLEDYYKRRICLSIPEETLNTFKKYVTIEEKIDHDKTPWLEAIKKLVEIVQKKKKKPTKPPH